MFNRKNLLLLLFAIYYLPGFSQISLVSFSTGYDDPVDIKNCGDDRLFIVEQRGKISISDTDGVRSTIPFLDIISRVQFNSEQGLLGLAFPADYQTSRYFYVNYTAKPNGETRISRFRADSLNPDTADPLSEEILLRIHQFAANHNGGHIAFGNDGYLYIGMGDGGGANDAGNRSQNPDSLLGKMLRISVDPSIPTYEIPPTNPFAQDTTLGRPEIWNIGLRNPWRWSFDKLTHDLWIGDVGQNQIEEIDFQPADSGRGWNYGWRCYEGDQIFNGNGCLSASNYIMPVHQYSHANGCSVTGGYVCRSAKYQELYGKYFYADYCVSEIQYLEPDGIGGFNNTNLGMLGAVNVSGFGEDRHGNLYCTGLNSGNIYRIVSADCAPVATINFGNDTIDDCSTGSVNLFTATGIDHTYLWTLNGDTISNTDTVTATQEGMYVLHVSNQSCTNSDSVFVDFTSPVVLSFSGLDSVYCIFHPIDNLSPNILGGYFAGAGITNASFNPAAAGIGTFIITYFYTNSHGCTFSYSQSVFVDACTDVPENVWMNSISVYPNPSNGDFYARIYSQVEKNLNMKIIDVTGRIIFSEGMKLNPGENKIPVNTGIAKGIYILQFSDGYAKKSLRVVMQ